MFSEGNFHLTLGKAGRASDIYHPKPIFICGFSLIGIAGIGGGFTQSISTLAIVRAIQGIRAAMTIPSATSMLTILYTTPMGRGIALTM
jgi:MFS family permease